MTKNMSKTRPFVIVTLNPSRDYLWEAHRAGCRDLAQRNGAHGFKSHTQTVEAATVDEAVTQFLDPETRELGWDEAAVLVLPCARRPDAYIRTEDYDPECSLCAKDHHSNHAEHEGAPSIGVLIDRAYDEARDRGGN